MYKCVLGYLWAVDKIFFKDLNDFKEFLKTKQFRETSYENFQSEMEWIVVFQLHVFIRNS